LHSRGSNANCTRSANQVRVSPELVRTLTLNALSLTRRPLTSANNDLRPAVSATEVN